uniref:Uncharacterized protein n=1 Tax=Plectus sambesii TaxID=2011161 RepID=A0A914UUA0_9BILA
MSEESVVDEPSSSSPPKKRRPGFDGSTEPFDRQPMDSMTPDEAAQLLTQMAADPQTPASPPPAGQQFSSPTRLIPTVAVDFGGIVAPTVIPPASGDRASLLSSGAQDAEVQPAKRERRKVTLDEYKKRKGPPRDAKKSGDEGSKLSDLDSPIASGPSSRPTTSFIPTLSEAELLESGRSHRLSSLPDPNQIGKTTVSVDDLKRRIYGKQFASANVPAGPLASSASSMETAQSDQQHSLPPPPPPPKKTEDQQRMSLADRLRTEFGLDDPSSEAPMPPPPPPPPPPPTAVVVDSLPGWSNGPSGAAAAASQPSAPGYQTRSSRRW